MYLFDNVMKYQLFHEGKKNISVFTSSYDAQV